MNERTRARVTAVIVNYRTADLTGKLVHRLTDVWPDVAVAVCDNSQDDKHWSDLTSVLPAHVHLVRSEGNPGFAGGVNRLMVDVSTPFALLLNPDLIDLPDVDALVATATSTGAAVVGPVVSDDRRLVRGSFGAAPTTWAFLSYVVPVPQGRHCLMSARTPGRDRTDVGWVTGACMLVAVDAWRDAPFDETLFMYGEDIDFCWRQRESGRRVVLDTTTTVRHLGAASSGGTTPVMWAENLVRVSRRRVRVARPCIAAGLALRGLRQRALGDRAGARRLEHAAAAALRTSGAAGPDARDGS